MIRNVILNLILSATFLSTTYAQNSTSPKLTGIGVVVTDLKKSIEFYTQVIGMVEAGGFSINADFSERSGLTGGIPFDVTVLKLEDTQESAEWKLMSFGTENSREKEKFIQENIGMQYITITVDALNPYIEKIRHHNVKMLGKTPTLIEGDRFFLLIQDPDGVFIELIGPLE